MSIRKRFDDAKRMQALGENEVALILLLVALGAASRKYCLAQTGEESRQQGGDKRWFVEYLRKSEMLPPISGPGVGGDIHDILYQELRCELVHEAQSKSLKYFDSENFFVMVDEGKIWFGPQLISAIEDTLIDDPVLHEEFIDLKQQSTSV